jgi:hypothetical protein
MRGGFISDIGLAARLSQDRSNNSELPCKAGSILSKI